MKITYKSSLLSLIGVLIGFTVAAIIRSFWGGGFDWGHWIAWMIGGIIGYFIVLLYLIGRDRKKDSES